MWSPSSLRMRFTGALVGVAAAVVLSGEPARSAPSPASLQETLALVGRMGERSAGVYQDELGAVVVAVTDAVSAREVRAAGAVAKVVSRSADDLTAIERVVEKVSVSGMSWGVEVQSNQVVVGMDDTVSDVSAGRVRHATKRFGTAVRVERIKGHFSLAAAGGDKISTVGDKWCSLGFNVRLSDGQPAFLTAGHCLRDDRVAWADANGTVLGVRIGNRFGPSDWGVVQYVNDQVARPGAVNMHDGTLRDITGYGAAIEGQVVARSGAKTGNRSGRVKWVNHTQNVGGVMIDDLIVTDACAGLGDSGGPLFAGNTALGLLVAVSGPNQLGSQGTCVDPVDTRLTYFQPVAEVVRDTGVQIY